MRVTESGINKENPLPNCWCSEVELSCQSRTCRRGRTVTVCAARIPSGWASSVWRPDVCEFAPKPSPSAGSTADCPLPESYCFRLLYYQNWTGWRICRFVGCAKALESYRKKHCMHLKCDFPSYAVWIADLGLTGATIKSDYSTAFEENNVFWEWMIFYETCTIWIVLRSIIIKQNENIYLNGSW